jgi:hypothetical protein
MLIAVATESIRRPAHPGHRCARVPVVQTSCAEQAVDSALRRCRVWNRTPQDHSTARASLIDIFRQMDRHSCHAHEHGFVTDQESRTVAVLLRVLLRAALETRMAAAYSARILRSALQRLELALVCRRSEVAASDTVRPAPRRARQSAQGETTRSVACPGAIWRHGPPAAPPYRFAIGRRR